MFNIITRSAVYFIVKVLIVSFLFYLISNGVIVPVLFDQSIPFATYMGITTIIMLFSQFISYDRDVALSLILKDVSEMNVVSRRIVAPVLINQNIKIKKQLEGENLSKIDLNNPE